MLVSWCCHMQLTCPLPPPPIPALSGPPSNPVHTGGPRHIRPQQHTVLRGPGLLHRPHVPVSARRRPHALAGLCASCSTPAGSPPAGITELRFPLAITALHPVTPRILPFAMPSQDEAALPALDRPPPRIPDAVSTVVSRPGPWRWLLGGGVVQCIGGAMGPATGGSPVHPVQRLAHWLLP